MNTLSRILLKAPAKINPFLEITGRRADGYHLLDSVMQSVGLCDLLLIGRTSAPGIRVSASKPGIPEDASNLAHRAATAFLEAVDGIGDESNGLHIHIDKRIPAGAGLGGGSADAAAVLLGLNRLFAAELSERELCALGGRLGADVPFALQGGCARVRGIGEQIESLSAGLPACSALIAKPAAGVCTQEAYARYDAQAESVGHRPIGPMLEGLSSGDLAAVGASMHNVFEQIGGDSETPRIVRAMRESGALGACLTGSGSAVVGLFAQRQQAEECAGALRELGDEVFLTAPRALGAEILWEE